MRALAARVARLERHRGDPTACPVCRSEKVLGLKIEGQPDPEGCPGCGKISTLVVITRGKPPEGWVRPGSGKEANTA